MKQEFHYFIGNQKINRYLESKTFIGDNKIYLDSDDDLTINTLWSSKGCTIIRIFEKKELNLVRQKLISIFKLILNKADKDLGKNINFLMDLSEDNFINLIYKTCYNSLAPKDIGLDLDKLTQKVSDLLGFQVQYNKFENNKKTIPLRIVRPNLLDFNPPHRDIYIDRLKNAINLYIPIFGDIQNSALPIIPGSHKWKDSMTIRTKTECNVDGKKI